MNVDLTDVPAELRRAVALTLEGEGIVEGHLSVEMVDEARIAELNSRHRGRDRPTDVLSFPIDGAGEAAGPRELGDVVICPARADDLELAAVHGVLHLLGHDHEADRGEMLERQDEILAELRRLP